MTRQKNDPRPSASADASPPPPPGWSDPEIQQHVKWRDGDIVVSVPIKSGTTWTMNIVHQLRAGGDPDFEDLYVEVPWLELVPGPTVTREQRLARLDAMPRDRRRAFKTHSAPGALPYQQPGVGKDVKYVVVVRNPDEAVASFYPFAAAHSAAWMDLWKVPPGVFMRPNFEAFYYDVARTLIGGMIFGFAAAWWPLRHAPNVLLIHYTDMKRDHDGSVRKIARFLGFKPTTAQWRAILECTSFSWMKVHEEKFEIRTAAEIPILDPGAMLRKGEAGAAAEDGVTPAISADFARFGREILGDESAFEWCYRGGPVPG